MSITGFLWKYVAGPIVADAQNVESLTWNGATAATGYNSVNTVLYALVATAIIYGVYRGFRRYNVEFTMEKVLYSLPFILLGGLMRFVEDTGVIDYPLSIILITPILHFAILGLYTATLASARKLEGLKNLTENQLMLYTGSAILLPAVIFTLNFFSGIDFRIDLLLTAFAIPIIVTAVYRFLVADTELDNPGYHLIVFSQLFGGASSMLAVTQGYEQKQLLTQAFTSIFGVSGILIAKTLLAALVIYALLDVEEEEFQALAVLVLAVVGLATGIRVLLRMLAGI
ncbi:DUF63 family protein [Candidatus Nanosalina sp. VS9-1]|uniref:DUF63 family protein n=1 Tax=Candidatus Nanosalina sp. VS9-1 TaxID=3388566 RepID=UPI0039E1138F